MTNDRDIQETIIAHRNVQFQRSKIAYEWLERNMLRECQDALIKFVSVNPQLRGIQWWDVLDMLDDSDSHLEFTEPMYEAMEDGEWTKLHTYIVMTLVYASKPFATEYTTAMRVDAVRATIGNNGGVPEGLS